MNSISILVKEALLLSAEHLLRSSSLNESSSISV